MTASLATRRLVEPDYWTCPHGIRTRPEPFQTYGPVVADLCARADFTPTPAQELGLDLIFAIRPDGSPASFAFCVVCFRQTMKTGLFVQAALGWIYVLDVDEIAWSAHEMTTTTDAQRKLEDLITGTPALSRRLPAGRNKGFYYGNRDQRAEFTSGQTIWFKARTESGSRGLSRRKLILDEAFALTRGMAGSVIPTLNAKAHAQVLYGSSAPKADSEELHDLRDRGRNGKSPRLSYLEWEVPWEACGDPKCRHPKDAVARGLDCALDRPRLREIAVAPSAGRISLEQLDDVRQELAPEEFARECYGWAEEPLALAEVIGPEEWHQFDGWPPEAGVRPAALAIDMNRDRLISVAACWLGYGLGYGEALGYGEPDRAYVEEVLGNTYDTLGVVDWVAGRSGRRMPVVIDAASPAAALAPSLKARGVKVHLTTAPEMGRACGLVWDEFRAGRLFHAPALGPDEELVATGAGLAAAIAGLGKRDIQGVRGAFAWKPKTEDSNIAPMVAATLARFGASLAPRRRDRRNRGESTDRNASRRRAVVL